MKQLVFMIVATLTGVFGAIGPDPFLGVAIYYLFGILRPQFLWSWALPAEIHWSTFVAIPTICAALFWRKRRGTRAGREQSFGFSHWAMFAFGFWVLVTYITALDPEAAQSFAVEYLKIFVMFATSALLIQRIREIWVMLILAAVALGFVAYEVNILYFVSHQISIRESGFGGLDNNGAGLMLAMGVPICFFLWESMRRRWRWLFLGLVPVILHAVLMTYSRGAMLSMLLASPLVLVRSRHKRQMCVAAIALVCLVPLLAGKEIRDRFMSIEQNETDASANSRRDSWNAAIRMALDYPVLGVGVRNSSMLSHQYGADIKGRVIHSQYLQILADSGFIGLALYLVVLGTAWRGLRRACRNSLLACHGERDSELVFASANAIECSMAIFCIGAAFLSLETFEMPYLLLLLAGNLDLLTSQHSEVASDVLVEFSLPVPAPAKI